MTRTCKRCDLTRRSFFWASVAATAGIVFPTAAIASDKDPFEDMSVGQYLRLFSPDVYNNLSDEMKETLDSSLMYRRTGMERAYLEQSVSIRAWGAGTSAIGFNFSFHCSVSCPSLYSLVTVTNLSTGASRQREFWGSGTLLVGGDTFYGFPSGTYRAVVTAFAPTPAIGMTSYYSQDWSTVYL